MEDFVLTDDMNLAIKILEFAGYAVKLGDKIFGDSKTFQILKDGKVKYGCSSTSMLNPMFAINQTIKKDSFKEGFEAGTAKLQKQIKVLLNIKED
jgi:hypothetical protein